MSDRQKTLKKEYIFEGKGLHSGQNVRMKLSPAPVNHGIRFLRKDLGDSAVIEALVDYVTYTQRGTTLENGEVRISTLEHLMAAFYGLGVDNALVTVDNFEVPILDGSALPYVRAILPDGLEEQDAERQYFVVREPIHYKDEKSGSEITVLPAEEFSVDLTIDFNSHVLGVQKFHYDGSTDFAREVAPCRTFVFFHEIEFLFKNNLIKGGDLDNALVIVEHPVSQEQLGRMASLFNVPMLGVRPDGYLDNITLRFPNECARHKLLDLMGDLRLAGGFLKARVTAYKAGHTINTRAAAAVSKSLK